MKNHTLLAKSSRFSLFFVRFCLISFFVYSMAPLAKAAKESKEEKQRIAEAKAAETAAYEARKAAFRVCETPDGQAPTVNTQVLSRVANWGTFSQPWEAPAPELWFPVGEIAHYDVLWGIFTVGTASARTDWVNIEGRRFLQLTMEAKSNGIVERLYPVVEFMQTLIDPVTFLPVSFEKQSSEGRHKYWEITTFDHEKKVGRWESLLRLNPETFPIEADTRDLLGLMYWIRKDPVRAGGHREFRVMTDEKLYELIIDSARSDTVSLEKYGKIPCIKMEPKGKFNGLFIRKGRMFVWVSDDARYTLCRVTASVPVASIKIMLQSIEGPGDDFWVKKKDKNEK